MLTLKDADVEKSPVPRPPTSRFVYTSEERLDELANLNVSCKEGTLKSTKWGIKILKGKQIRALMLTKIRLEVKI